MDRSPTPFANLTGDPWVPMRDVLRAFGYRHRSSIWRNVRDGKFPPPERTAGGHCRWRASVLAEYRDDPNAWVARNSSR